MTPGQGSTPYTLHSRRPLTTSLIYSWKVSLIVGSLFTLQSVLLVTRNYEPLRPLLFLNYTNVILQLTSVPEDLAILQEDAYSLEEIY